MADVISQVGTGTSQPSDFELFINGVKFTHFTRGFVKLSFEQAASQFEFSYADLRENLDDVWPIRAGDACEIRLRKQLLVTGYIDDIAVQYEADRVEFTARGRSKLGDLVDSSAHYKRGRWSSATLEEIATNLVEPFDGIEVEVDPVKGYNARFKHFAIDQGESVMETISRAARPRGLHPVSTPKGNLRLMSAGQDTLDYELHYGVNIIRGERLDSHLSRHSAYFLRGQSPGDDEADRETITQEEAAIFDANILRYRPLLLVGSGHQGRAALKRRAIWERNRRAGQGERVIYRVDGFGPDDTSLWMPGPLVRIFDRRLQVDGALLLIACAYTFAAEGDEGGRVTDLTFVRKAAFDLVEAYPRTKRRRPREPKSTGTIPWLPGSEALTSAEEAELRRRHSTWDGSGSPSTDSDFF